MVINFPMVSSSFFSVLCISHTNESVSEAICCGFQCLQTVEKQSFSTVFFLHLCKIVNVTVSWLYDLSERLNGYPSSHDQVALDIPPRC